jgi:Ca2+-binding RTX toxin-like protein
LAWQSEVRASVSNTSLVNGTYDQHHSTKVSQAVTGTTGNDAWVGIAAGNTLIGHGGADTYVMNAADQPDTIVNTAAAHDQLWLEPSASNLVVDILGTGQKTIIQNR